MIADGRRFGLSMRAVTYDPHGASNLAFADVSEPIPADDQVTIDVKAIALNFGEVRWIADARQPGEVPGWDTAGTLRCCRIRWTSEPPPHCRSRELLRCRHSPRWDPSSGEATTIDSEAERHTGARKRLEPFGARVPFGTDLAYLVELVAKEQLDPQIGLRDSWENVTSAADALLGRRVAGKAVLGVG
jgi:NADPH:quinone reductase-like Zn-dependent oxidoreductase